eukprot:TRINITY_DN1414_c0_g1_i1.p1 TRINITY_DN1414_c0_g1~~TRINITY_DN1414_c0_g1_i1.p1  ORF type:complete len:385 (-),score=21.21 TRINITY_DN1414_c0_g1_i1:47-1201(-)
MDKKWDIKSTITKSLQPNSPLFVIIVAIAFFCGTYFSLWVFNRAAKCIDAAVIRILAIYISGFIGTSLLIAKYSYTLLSRVLYYIVALFWGFLVYYLFFAALYLSVNYFYPLPKMYGLALLFVPTLSLYLYGLIKACYLDIERIQVKFAKLKKPIKIAHLSDLHLGPIYGYKYVAKLVKELIKLSPDIVAITGDLFDGSTPVIAQMLEPFNDLPMPTYMVLGNHDMLVAGAEKVEAALKSTKIVLLKDQQVECKGVNIIGINYSSDWDYVSKKMMNKELLKSTVNVLLYHVPEKASKVEEYGVDLFLAGHTHGGQMFPFNISASIMFAYLKGLKRSNKGSYVHVSQGTGTSGPPMRVGSNTVITMLELSPAQQQPIHLPQGLAM